MGKDVISFGEALWDLLPEGPVLGGAPCNLACRVRELGNDALLVSRVGDDDLGREALARMRALGLDTAHVQVDPDHPTGTVEITLDENRQPDYVIIPRVAYDYIALDDRLLEAARRADCICFGSLAQRSTQSREALSAMLDAAARGNGALTFLDINLRKDCYTPETVADSLRRAMVLKLNEEELVLLGTILGMPARDSLTARAEEFVRDWRLQHCLVTLAERGALCVSADGNAAYEPGYAIELVDPCGAGDAFSAGFLHRLMEGGDIRDCLRLGNALGAAVASQRGATEPIDAASLERFKRGDIGRHAEESLRNLDN